jgi:hypothetical protein
MTVLKKIMHVNSPSFKVGPSTMPTAKKGVFAAKDVPQFTFIGVYPGRVYPTAEFAQWLREGKKSLDYAVELWDVETDGTLVEGRFVIDPTRGKSMPDPEFANGTALYINEPPMAQLNISSGKPTWNVSKAKPNAMWVFNIAHRRMEVFTSRPVKAGEEIWVCYGANYHRHGYVTSCNHPNIKDIELETHVVYPPHIPTPIPRSKYSKSMVRMATGGRPTKRARLVGANAANGLKTALNRTRLPLVVTNAFTRARPANASNVPPANASQLRNYVMKTRLGVLAQVGPTPTEAGADAAKVTLQNGRDSQVVAKTTLWGPTRLAVCCGSVFTNKDHKQLIGEDHWKQWTVLKNSDGSISQGYMLTTSTDGMTLNSKFQNPVVTGYSPFFKQSPTLARPTAVYVINAHKGRLEYWSVANINAGHPLQLAYHFEDTRFPTVYLLYGTHHTPVSVDELAANGLWDDLRTYGGFDMQKDGALLKDRARQYHLWSTARQNFTQWLDDSARVDKLYKCVAQLARYTGVDKVKSRVTDPELRLLQLAHAMHTNPRTTIPNANKRAILKKFANDYTDNMNSYDFSGYQLSAWACDLLLGDAD